MIVATAGHVDHGKTSLITALTGVETDRLPEEKRRGLTIDIGFAYQHLSDNCVLGFVDVPGHERFIRNMIAGVSAIDFALLVIAADDGVMPQTREHLEIISLLGIKQAAVVITKTDLVDSARVCQVQADAKVLLAETEIVASAAFAVSVADNNSGVSALASHLAGVARAQKQRTSSGMARFSVDRCFIKDGAGLIVTGTVVSGLITHDTPLVLSSTQQSVRVRGIHAHDKKAVSALAGQRCALNISGLGLERSDVTRGDWVLAPSLYHPVTRMVIRVQVLMNEAKPLRGNTEVHVHLGARQVMGRLNILGQRAIAPGQDGLAQLTLVSPVVAMGQDRLILRDKSASRTVAGGYVIDPFPQAGSARNLSMIAAMDKDNPDAAMSAMLLVSTSGVDLTKFQRLWGLSDEGMQEILAAQPVMQFERKSTRYALLRSVWEAFVNAVISALSDFHIAEPAEPGLRENDLRTRLGASVPRALFPALVSALIETERVERRYNVLCLAGHVAEMSQEDQAFWGKLQVLLLQNGLRPPPLHDLCLALGEDAKTIRGKLTRLIRHGLVVQVTEKRYFHFEQIAQLSKLTKRCAEQANDNRFTVAEYRDLTGIGRNIAIDVLEYFDRENVTKLHDTTRRVLH